MEEAEALSLITARTEELGGALDAFAEGGGPAQLAAAAGLIEAALRDGGKVIAFGNGGSAAHAQHLVAELVGRYLMDRDPLPAISLSDNASSVTAIANDYGNDNVFERQVRALGRSGDAAVGISTSGESANVVGALRRAGEMGLSTIAITGPGGGDLAETVDCCVSFDAESTPRIQEGHQLVVHLICEIVERELSGGA